MPWAKAGGWALFLATHARQVTREASPLSPAVTPGAAVVAAEAAGQGRRELCRPFVPSAGPWPPQVELGPPAASQPGHSATVRNY